MREPKNIDHIVAARLRSILPPPVDSARYRTPDSVANDVDIDLLDESELLLAMALDASPAAPFANISPAAGTTRAEGVARPADLDQGAAMSALTRGAALDGSELNGRGAFGGGHAGSNGRRISLRSFDPGRRGVAALAAVALVAIVVAAFLAWQARPRSDVITPPSFARTGASDRVGRTDSAPAAAGAGTPASSAELIVAVAGKVHKPGLVHVSSGARVADVLAAAGGAENGIDVAQLNLARKVVDGELILVGVAAIPGVAVAAGPQPAGAGGTRSAPINLNTATIADLDTLPGVGPVLAQRILDARDAASGFKSVADLRKVDGIGDARFEQLKKLVTV